jgi:hypothetical protein
MRGENQRPVAGLLICRKATRCEGANPARMSNRSLDGVNAMLCPACARPTTHVRTIWRAFADDLQVFECRACNVSVSMTMPPRSKKIKSP